MAGAAPTLLVTGFGAFPGVADNPSAKLVARLRERPPESGAARLAFAVLPVTWRMLGEDLPDLHARHRPAAVVHFGVAARRRMISIETRARNAGTLAQVDADGARRADGLLDPAGPATRACTLAPHALRDAVAAAGVPVRLSRDAGDYLCNATYWMSLAAGLLAVFVHLPPARESAGRGLPEAMLEQAGRRVVSAVARQIDR